MLEKIMAALLAVICATTGLSYENSTVEDISKYVASDYTSVSDYICDNLSLLTDAYNEAKEENDIVFNATSCEARIPVYVMCLDQNGLYLDFDGNNGYMIVVDDYEVVAFEPQGDLEYLKNLDSCIYTISDGFVYYDDNHELVPYEPKGTLTEEEWEDIELNGKKYAGQNSSGDGDIVNTDKYVKDRYGKKYKLYKSKSLKNFQYMSQYDLSVYYKIKNKIKYSEGNCTLSSIYALLNYLQSSGKYENLPSSKDMVLCDATKDKFYSKYRNKKNYVIETSKQLPELYNDIRNYVIKHNGYEVGSTNPFKIEYIVENVAKKHGYKSVQATHIVLWSYKRQVMDEINGGHPIIWNCANSSTYGSHSLVVTGYKQYRKTTNILGIKFYDYVNLMEVNDNWEASSRFLDFTSYYAFGSFVKVR